MIPMNIVNLFYIGFLNLSKFNDICDVKMFDRVNSYRVENNLNKLIWNENLRNSAIIQTNYQTKINQMTHENIGDNATLEGRLINGDYRGMKTWGENVAWCSEGLDEEVMEKWIKSPKHNANLLGNFTEGAVFSRLSDDNIRYWTMVFGTRFRLRKKLNKIKK